MVNFKFKKIPTATAIFFIDEQKPVASRSKGRKGMSYYAAAISKFKTQKITDMKIELSRTYSVKGYSKLYGVDRTRIKAVNLTINTNSFGRTIDEIRKVNGSYTKEYRLVKESEGYIFREVLLDSGMNGHKKTMKEAIASALCFASIHIDEPFTYEHLSEFKEIKRQHAEREKGTCTHSQLNDSYKCLKCGLYMNPDHYKQTL